MSADTLGGVVQLINRLQRACGDMGENAASEDVAGLLNLWQLLPSIVVIGGQVLSLHQGDKAIGHGNAAERYFALNLTSRVRDACNAAVSGTEEMQSAMAHGTTWCSCLLLGMYHSSRRFITPVSLIQTCTN